MLELVRALAIAWKNLAAYPPGHPALVASLALAHRRFQELLAEGGTVVLGVARDGLLHGQEKLTSSHARDLGRALLELDAASLSGKGETAIKTELILQQDRFRLRLLTWATIAVWVLARRCGASAPNQCQIDATRP